MTKPDAMMYSEKGFWVEGFRGFTVQASALRAAGCSIQGSSRYTHLMSRPGFDSV